jgi:hypothetical protein
MDGENLNVTRKILCRFCHSYTYRVTFTLTAAGTFFRGECANCGTQRQSLHKRKYVSQKEEGSVAVQRLVSV